MAYIGKVPADVLIDPMVDSAAITDATIVTADIADDAVTSAKLAANSVDSSELIDGSVDNSHLAGSIAVNKTLLAGGTGLTLSTNTLNVDAAQTQITSVGTLTGLTVAAHTLINPSASTSSYLQFATGGTTYGYVGSESSIISGGTAADMTIAASGNTNLTLATNGAVRATIEGDGTFAVAGTATFSGNTTFAEYLKHDGDSDTHFRFSAANNIEITAGSHKMMRFEGNAQEVIVNEDQTDINLRVESQNQSHMFFVDAGQDRVGINTDDPGYELDVRNVGDDVTIRAKASSGVAYFRADSGANTNAGLQIGENGTNKWTLFNDGDSNDDFKIEDDGHIRLTMAQGSGDTIFAGDVTLGGDTQLETAYTNLQLYMPSNATGLVLANGAATADARNWGIYTNYSHWGALDFRVSSANGTAVAHTTEVLSLKKDGTLYQATTFASGTNAYIAAFASNNAYEFIVNGDDRYYLFNAWQTSWSDRKLKKNIASITGGLDICDKLNPVTFNWKKEWAEGDAGLSNRKFYGIIAQELQEVLPELVYEGKDKLMVQRDELQWVLLAAVKELSAKVKALESA